MKNAEKARCSASLLIALSLIIPLCFTGCAQGGEGVSGKYVTAENEVEYQEYLSIPLGEGKTALGGYSSQKAESLGPKSFAVMDNGSVYILDTQKHRIVQYSGADELLWSAALPDEWYAIDMDVSGDEIYVASSECDIYATGLGNVKSIGRQRIGSLSRTDLAGLYAENGGVYCRSWTSANHSLTLSGIEPFDETEMARSDIGVSLKKSGTIYDVKCVAEPIGCFVIKSVEDSTYIMEQEALMEEDAFAETRVGRYIDGQKAATALPISTANYIYALPFKKLYITASGCVYQMMQTSDSVVIYQFPWFDGEKARITQEMLRKTQAPSKSPPVRTAWKTVVIPHTTRKPPYIAYLLCEKQTAFVV